MAGDDGLLAVEVVYALPALQAVVGLRVARGTTALQAIVESGLLQRFPEIDAANLKIGVFGRFVAPDTILKAGDRVEIYRALAADPKDARRRRVKAKAR
jgi:hypothetical protein